MTTFLAEDFRKLLDRLDQVNAETVSDVVVNTVAGNGKTLTEAKTAAKTAVKAPVKSSVKIGSKK